MYMHYSDFVFSQHLCGDTPDHRGADAAGSGGDVSDDSLRAVHADRTAVIIHSDVEIAPAVLAKATSVSVTGALSQVFRTAVVSVSNFGRTRVMQLSVCQSIASI